MNRGRTALGKGLSALIPPPRYANANDDYFACPIDQIRPDPDQPRQQFDDDRLDELVASIKEKGILQPIVVRKFDDGYIVIAGERRLRAANKAGLKDVPVLLKDVASDEAFELALIENIQREDLNPIEEAAAFQRLIDDAAYTQEVLAHRLGKKRSTIANALRLLRLNSAQQQLLIDRRLTAGHARCLLAFDDEDTRARLATTIQEDHLSVRQAEAMVKQIKREAGPHRRRLHSKPSALQPYCDQIASELNQALGAPVQIKARGRKGRIVINFTSLDDLRRLHSLLSPTAPVAGDEELTQAVFS